MSAGSVSSQRLSFRKAQANLEFLIEDIETETVWEPLTGVALRGPLNGTRLEQVPSHYEFWFAWKDYRPNTEVYLGTNN